MRAALYARVSTEAQADRGTIGSQLQLLREHIAAAGDELIGEYVDDGYSGARLDRPGLDTLRDAAEAGLVERVWCLSPDRLARAYAYQVLVLDELDRFGVTVAFTDSPGLAADDPQSVLLTQVQGVIAEYEKAKIAERYRRGKLFRARAGEIVTWKAPYGYRRIPRSAATGQAHHEVYEPEAAVVRRIFSDCAAGITAREIAAAVLTPMRYRHRPANPPGSLHAQPAAAQRGLHRPGLLQPHRFGARPAPHRPQPPNPTQPRRMDPHRLPPDHPRRVVPGRRPRRHRQHQMEPAPRRTRRLAAQRTGQMRRVRGGHQLPQDARPQRHLAPLVPLPQPRPHPRRRRIPPLP